jgi:RND family efflux transporter MFP subunit
MKNLLVKFIIPVAILAVGVAGYALMRAMGDPPTRIERPHLGPLVQAVSVPANRTTIVVEGQGTVRPGAQIDLVPQVPGIAVWKSPELESGGIFAAGDLLLQIDARDYELTVRQAAAAVAQSRYRLDIAREEAEVARQEWERIDDSGEEPGQLVLRIPQLRAAKADLQAAQARLEEAELRLSRTRIHAPFDGRVRSARVDAGQHLNAGQPFAQIYSIEKAEIVVPIPDADLAWFPLPLPGRAPNVPQPGQTIDAPAETPGRPHLFSRKRAAAAISGTFAGRSHQWQGHVVRTEGELDPQSRMVRLVIEVDKPYAGIAAGQAPLTVGMFVDVAIAGRPADDVRTLPRSALRQGDKVWTVSPAGILRVRNASVLRTMKEEVLIRLDIPANEQIVISQLSGVTDGMKVRLTGEEVGS